MSHVQGGVLRQAQTTPVRGEESRGSCQIERGTVATHRGTDSALSQWGERAGDVKITWDNEYFLCKIIDHCFEF